MSKARRPRGRSTLRRVTSARRHPPPSPYTPIALRAHTEPSGWAPRSHKSTATPGVALVVRSVPRDEPGESAAFWVFAVMAPPLGAVLPRGGFGLPEPEPVVMGAAYPWDATPREIEGLTRACEAYGLGPPHFQGEFARLLLRTCWTDRAALAAFHLPRECGRLAVHWARAATKPGRGGLVMTFATVPGEPWRRQALCDNGEIQDPDFPRIVFLPIDAKRCRIWFKPVAGIPQWGGVFASLQPMAEALAGEELDTLQAACDAFGIVCPPAAAGPTFGQALGELVAECRLYRALLEEHVRLCPDEPPTAYVSPGTYTRALLRATGLRPLLDRFPDTPRPYLAATMGAYHAGDVFCRARGSASPCEPWISAARTASPPD